METTRVDVTHDPILVVLSFIVAMFAAYAALATLTRLRQGGSTGWLWLGAVSFGLGVWAMHFIGMSALNIGVLVGYDLGITLLSMVFGILGAAVAFQLVRSPTAGFGQVLLSGISLGLGIGSMHYVGMQAMRMEVGLRIEPTLFGVSVLVAAVLGVLGMWMLTSPVLQNSSNRTLLASVVTGLAIPLMHYVAMLAAQFVTGPGVSVTDEHQGILSLNTLILVAVGLIGLPAFLTSLETSQAATSGEGA
jgi:NO-binding membrane sensor protein with MHYT domain